MKVLVALILGCATIWPCSAGNRPLKLHYNRPAQFFEEALVIGNGHLGATVYGGVNSDRISLNDITLWTGEPDTVVYSPEAFKAIPAIREALDRNDFRTADSLQRLVQGHYSENYQPLGNLMITRTDGKDDAKDYYRELDIRNAIASKSYTVDGKRMAAEYFASAPDSVIVVRLSSNAKDGFSVSLSFNSQLPCNTRTSDGMIVADGYAAYHSLPGYYKAEKKHFYDPKRGTRFTTLIKPMLTDGSMESLPDGTIRIKNCHEAVILITNATSFNGFNKNPATEGKDNGAIARNIIRHASGKNYKTLLKNHIKDYRHFFDRVEIDLGETDPKIASLPTDRQLLLYTEENTKNPELEVLYFQFGRYLLISCSRTPGVPANLQGLWNEKILPPWSCNYTSNINLEENYWPAETTNLSELHMPLMDFIAALSATGEKTAKAYYGVSKGWNLGQNTDIWAMTCPVGLHTGNPSWANWTMGGSWLSTHIWEHFQFTRDKEFLKQYYPYLKGAADFCLEWLIEKDGKLTTSPGTSPENAFITADGYRTATSTGTTADIAMIRECLEDAANAAAVLEVDAAFIESARDAVARLEPYKIGGRGQLQEWAVDWKEAEPTHRHQSHLFGLYPGHHLSPDATPDLAKAALKTLELRGDRSTGWSTGWRVNLFARLREPEKAYHIYRKLLNYVSPDGYTGKDAKRGGGTYPNLLDAHSPFQIDGNFGGTAGVAEMLLQSTPESITILPALPLAWKSGSVKGLKARGGFEVDIKWNENKKVRVTVKSKTGGCTRIIYGDKQKDINLKPGGVLPCFFKIAEKR